MICEVVLTEEGQTYFRRDVFAAASHLASGDSMRDLRDSVENTVPYGIAGYLEIDYNGDRADKRLNMGVGILVGLEIDVTGP